MQHLRKMIGDLSYPNYLGISKFFSTFSCCHTVLTLKTVIKSSVLIDQRLVGLVTDQILIKT